MERVVTNGLPARSCAGFENFSSGREEWKGCVTNGLPARSCAGFEDSSVEGVCNK